MMKNHESRPTRTTPLLEANVVNFNRGRGRGHSHGRGRDLGGRSYNLNFKRAT